MTNPEFTLADLLRTAQHLDDLDDQIIQIDDPGQSGPDEDIPFDEAPVGDVPFGDVPVEDDPIIRIDDPGQSGPDEDIPFGDEPTEDDPIIQIDDPVDPEPGEDVPIGNWEDGEAEDAGSAQPEGIKAWDDPNYNPPDVYTLAGPGEGEVHDEPVEDAPAEADDFSVA